MENFWKILHCFRIQFNVFGSKTSFLSSKLKLESGILKNFLRENVSKEKLKRHSEKAMTTSYEKNMPRRFLVTGVQLPDTSTDQTHMQLSRSYIIAYTDSSLNEILWNIETSLWKSSPWELLEEQKRNTRCFFRKVELSTSLPPPPPHAHTQYNGCAE